MSRDRLVTCVSLTVLACAACGDQDVAPAAGVPSGPLSGFEQLVPFATPLEGAPTQPANNNLDVVSVDGSVLLAFRTAPTHFASDKTQIHVVREEPRGVWTPEATFSLGTDVREPRFLDVGGRTFLYFAVLGKDPLAFEPQGARVSERLGPGHWTEPEPIFADGFIPWRGRVVGGRSTVIGYVGGENIYEPTGEPLEVSWLATDDGRTFEPVVPGHAVVLVGGTSETDFAIRDDGSLVAVARNEAGDADGWGSKICTADASALGDWTCASDKKKYDSPLVFRSGSDVYLVGRRNLTDTGNYDLDRDDLPPIEQTQTYEVTYSFQPKRCSLWRVDAATRSVAFVLDLPSRGDTCFASALEVGPGELEIYNYSNRLDGEDCPSYPEDCEDYSWIEGQGLPTIIYRVRLSLP